MKYKADTLKIGSEDIPEGCIPIKYNCSIERRDPSISLVRTLAILRPMEDEKTEIEDKKKDIYEKCFFCEKNYTNDKVGIRPICPICLSGLYGLARKSHKSREC